MKEHLHIVADENIPFVREFFSDIGTVLTLPGRNMCADDVRDADILLVRSVTTVNESLLAGSRVAFVGTCTIGVDHLDIPYLESAGITVASAPGCNANSVVEYVFSVLARLRSDWLQRSFGIIGCGNVGGALYRRLKALGLPVVYYDPLLSPESKDPRDPRDSVALERVLACDVVAMHAPLTRTGPQPSHHLLGAEQLALLQPGALLINAGRGPVIDNGALKQFLRFRPDVDVALDVWEFEPLVDLELLPQVALATPHIAGYSFDGKAQGTAMIYRALCQFLGRPEHRAVHEFLSNEGKEVGITATTAQACANQAILGAYDVAGDDANMRQELSRAAEAVDSDTRERRLREAFDGLRKNYPVRREFFTAAPHLPEQCDIESPEMKGLKSVLATLGFGRCGDGLE